MTVSRPATARRPPHGARKVLVCLAATALVVGLAGCGSDKASGSKSSDATVDTLAPPTRVDGSEVTVKAIDNDFEPKHLVVKVGTKVTFDNTGRNVHDVVPSDSTSMDFKIASEDFGPGAEKSFTFDKSGTYAYYCSLHATATAGSMRGVITVEP